MPGPCKQDPSPLLKAVTGPRGGFAVAALLKGLLSNCLPNVYVYTHSALVSQVREASFCNGLLLQILTTGQSAETK